jgi:hypothetical protein
MMMSVINNNNNNNNNDELFFMSLFDETTTSINVNNTNNTNNMMMTIPKELDILPPRARVFTCFDGTSGGGCFCTRITTTATTRAITTSPLQLQLQLHQEPSSSVIPSMKKNTEIGTKFVLVRFFPRFFFAT